MTHERHPLEPFLPTGAKMLILGSFPPSRERWCMDFFYPNFQNDMWRIMGIVFYGNREHFIVPSGKRFNQALIEKFCIDKGIAMFDMARAVVRLRDNASDKYLRIAERTDIIGLLRQIPECTTVIVTGALASSAIADALGCKEPPMGGKVDVLVDGKQINVYRMPSSSRAYPMNPDKKADYYRKVLGEL